MTITVACVWVRGHVPFTAEYVFRLRDMARRHVGRAHRFVCLTDRPEELPSIETLPCQCPPGCKGWWAKISLFSPALKFTGRILYLDLDVLLLGGLDEIIDYPAPFALAADGAPNFHGHGALRVVKRFNSSVMVWDAGEHPEIYTDWTPADAARLWGDQDWIGETAPWAAAMPLAWTPRISEGPPWPPEAKVVLCKKPKNVEAAARWPWFAEAWG